MRMKLIGALLLGLLSLLLALLLLLLAFLLALLGFLLSHLLALLGLLLTHGLALFGLLLSGLLALAGVIAVATGAQSDRCRDHQCRKDESPSAATGHWLPLVDFVARSTTAIKRIRNRRGE